VLDDLPDRVGLGDEGQDAKLPPAGTEKGVGFENSSNQICPSFPESGTLLGVGDGVAGLGGVLSGRSFFELEALFFPQRPRSGGIGSKVVWSMFSRLWDLGEDPGEELEDVEGLALGVFGEGVVVRNLASIKECHRARGPVGSLQGERTAQEVTADALDSG